MCVRQSATGLISVAMLDGDRIISYESSNPKIVSVTNAGRLKARKKGKAEITVRTAYGASAKAVVTVKKKKVKTNRLTITADGLIGKNLVMKKKQKIRLTVWKIPFTSQDAVTFTSSDKKTVSVTARGVVKAVKAGKAKITVKSGKKKAVIRVTVK